MNRRVIYTALFAFACSAASAQTASGKKLIEWGWDEPGTDFLKANAAKMETMPFDGFVFHVKDNGGSNLSWNIWNPIGIDISSLSTSLADIKAAKFTKLTDRFLRVNVTPGTVDWFDQTDWQGVLKNSATAAQFSYLSGSKGLLFDMEAYAAPVWDYSKQKYHASKSFAEYQAMVRQRGREWIAAVNAQQPNLTIFLASGYEIASATNALRSTDPYGLWPSFLDGMLEAATTGTTIVDGYEMAYGFRQASQFKAAQTKVKSEMVNWSAVPAAYKAHIKVGFGLWMDFASNKYGWNVDNFLWNYFKPSQIQASLNYAFQNSDGYVWLYTEQPKWWTNEKIPAAYVSAIGSVKK